jgi:hypothetical protein
LVKEVIDEKASKLYRDWKHNMGKHYTHQVDRGLDPYQHPYKGANIDGWRFMIDHIFKDSKLKVTHYLLNLHS